MRANCVVFPFDLFGSGGSAAGAMLLGDSLQEMIDDTAAETQPVRLKAAAANLDIHEMDLSTIELMANWQNAAREMCSEILHPDEFTLWLSGNHLGVAPVLESLEVGTLIIQFDAHLDCYDLHDTYTTLSHGNFVAHLPDAVDIVNVGHRDLFLPHASIRKHFTEAFAADEDEAKVIAALRKRVAKAKHVWLDIDADVFDPSVCPAVTTPAPFGLMPLQVLQMISAIDFDKLCGVSLSEFEPGRDVKNASLDLLGWLLEWLLLKKIS